MTENTKLVKTCNTTRKIIKVMRICMYVAIVMFIFVAAATQLPMFADMPITAHDNITGAEVEVTPLYMLTTGSFAVATLIIGSVVFLLSEKVLNTVKTESTPFVAENVKRIKAIAILTAITGVVPSWISQIVSLFGGNKDIFIDVSVDKIVIGLVIWCVALIFEYGVNLQQRDDETL